MAWAVLKHESNIFKFLVNTVTNALLAVSYWLLAEADTLFEATSIE